MMMMMMTIMMMIDDYGHVNVRIDMTIMMLMMLMMMMVLNTKELIMLSGIILCIVFNC